MKKLLMSAVLAGGLMVGSAQAVDFGAAVSDGVTTYNKAKDLNKTLPQKIKDLKAAVAKSSEHAGAKKGQDIAAVLNIGMGVVDDVMEILVSAIKTVSALKPEAEKLLYLRPEDKESNKLTGAIGAAKYIIGFMRQATEDVKKAADKALEKEKEPATSKGKEIEEELVF
jgi:hypothetical protein